MKEALIQLRDVAYAYGPGRTVLDGVEMALYPGETLGLAGANGSGKTTLLRLITGLLRPGRGHLELFGQERTCRTDFDAIRGRVGMVFQDSDDQLFCPTVIDDVAFGPLNLGASADAARTAASRALESLGLSGYEDRTTYALSGGEKRLIALATVLAMTPDVLLLDEPLNGLDATSAARVTEVLEQLPQAILVVSHHPGFLESIANRVCRLEKGKVIGGTGTGPTILTMDSNG